MAAALSPVFGNLNLCIFYGFHPIYFAIPALLLFFIFRAGNNRPGMILCMFATMMMKETMMIFWTGYGLWLLTRRGGKTRIAGGVLTVFSLFGFFFY